MSIETTSYKVNNEGQNINVRKTSDTNQKAGITNVFAPGAWVESAKYLDKFFQKLAPEIETHSITSPGHGKDDEKSDLPKRISSIKGVKIGHDIEAIYKVLQNIIQTSEDPKIVLSGHSKGAYEILELLGKYKDDKEIMNAIKKVFLLAPPGNFEVFKATLNYILKHKFKGFGKVLKAFANLNVKALVEEDKIAEDLLFLNLQDIKNYPEIRGNESFLCFLEMVLEIRNLFHLGNIRQAINDKIVYIMTGSEDNIFSYQNSKGLGKKLQIPEDNVIEMKGNSHYLMLDPNYEEVAEKTKELILKALY